MKKLLIIFLLIISLTSCFWNKDENKLDKKEKTVINNSSKDYEVETLGVWSTLSDSHTGWESADITEVIDISTGPDMSSGSVEVTLPQKEPGEL